MAAMLIPLSLALQTALFALNRPLRPGLAREAFLKAAVVVGLIVVVLTELLSLVRGLSFGPLLASWLFVILVQEACVVFFSGGWGLGGPRAWGLQKFSRAGTMPREDQAAIALAAATLTVCAAAALLCPPNNFDSLAYHMPRVMHWLQNESVAHYPANDLRQLAFPPGASYLVAQLQILAGTDRFAAAPQWLALIGCLCGAPMIARGLGAGRSARVLAVALAAGLPMAVLQAETTQNDLLTAFWLVCFCAFALREGDYERSDLFWLSASLGLAVLTKPTGLLFGAPLLLVVLARLFRRSSEPAESEEAAVRHLAWAGAVLLLSGLVSAGPLWRNKAALGAFAPEDGRTLKAAVGARQTAACAIKNAALELPLTPIWGAVLAVERHVLRLDPEDLGNNFDPAATRSLSSLCRRLVLPDEDFAGSPVNFLLLVWALGVLSLALWREEEDPWSDRTALAAALTAGFLLFCAFFKWQEWANRLMLPLFVLAAPLTAQILEKRLEGTARKGLLALLGATGLFYAAAAVHRPLWALAANAGNQWRSPSVLKADRETLLLSGYAKTVEKPLRAIIGTAVKDKCGYIGLSLGPSDMEYAWWALWAQRGPAGVMIKNVNVANASAALPPEFPSDKLCGVAESQGGVMMYFDRADMAKMHAAGRHEPPPISEIRKN
ncbi:MAG: glycosyltransferase family 39 protein [Elusimicrobia bacterium]|nr:glycosyltransferase family 39 protein [Elusimicrobiota bacterium]